MELSEKLADLVHEAAADDLGRHWPGSKAVTQPKRSQSLWAESVEVANRPDLAPARQSADRVEPWRIGFEEPIAATGHEVMERVLIDPAVGDDSPERRESRPRALRDRGVGAVGQVREGAIAARTRWDPNEVVGVLGHMGAIAQGLEEHDEVALTSLGVHRTEVLLPEDASVASKRSCSSMRTDPGAQARGLPDVAQLTIRLEKEVHARAIWWPLGSTP